MRLTPLLLLIGPVAAWRPTYLFRQWYPNWRTEIATAMESPLCQTNMAAFRNTSNPVQTAFGVIDCILKEWPEFRQAELSAAGVILGLIPPMLSWFSPPPTDIAVVALHDPLLAALLATANAEVLPQLPTQYNTAIAALQMPAAGDVALAWMHAACSGSPARRRAVALMPYVLAAAAAANTLYVVVRLTTWAVCSFSPGLNIFPPMWMATAFICYGVGVLLVRLRYRQEHVPWEQQISTACIAVPLALGMADSNTTGMPLLGLPGKEVAHEEKERLRLRQRQRLLLTCKYQPDQQLDRADKTQWKMVRREWIFRVLAGLLYLGSFIHMTFGTIVFASLLFISVRDSTEIGLQLIGSTLVTRIVLYFRTASLGVQLRSS